MGSFLDGIPGYRDAVSLETVGRDAAYLRLPRLVSGVALRPLTLREYLRLSTENSPFISGGTPTRGDVCFLLWNNRADADPADDRKAFVENFDGIPLEFLTASCCAYVSEALADAPKGGGGTAGFYSLAAAILDAKQFEHRCTREEVLDSPMDELLQDLRVIRQRRYPNTILFNPSDRLKSEWLRSQNEELKRGTLPPKTRERQRQKRS